jgi:hypothetical protein
MVRIPVQGKLERWKLLFDGSPGFRCDVRTIILKINKLSKVVEVEQQFWFRTVSLRSYKSPRAIGRARQLYSLIKQGESKLDCGYRDTPLQTVLWFNMKVYGKDVQTNQT